MKGENLQFIKPWAEEQNKKTKQNKQTNKKAKQTNK